MDQRNFYSGHKLDYGLNLQAACDANCRFVNASLCCPGSANDILAYNASYLPNRYAHYPYPFFVAGIFHASSEHQIFNTKSDTYPLQETTRIRMKILC